MGTPDQAGEPHVVAPAKIAGRKRAGLPVSSRTAAVTGAFPRQVAV
jgi:hypothetical protein